METKIRVETIRKETPIYVAIDGTEFHDKEACEHYEQDYLRHKATKAYDALPKISISPAEDILGLGWTSDQYEFVYIRSERDVEIIKEYLSYEDECNLSDDITSANIGSTVLIIFDETEGYAFLVNKTYDEYMKGVMETMLSIKSEISDLIKANKN